MDKQEIPEPLKSDKFELFQRGILDDPDIDVYASAQKDFAFLYPRPQIDYVNYIPRATKHGFNHYKKKLDFIGRRLKKIEHLFGDGPDSLLEIGAADGSFLEVIGKKSPDIHLTAIDKDQNTLPLRVKRSDENYCSLEELPQNRKHYDRICLFHVFEHVLTPSDLLSKIRKIMSASSLLIIETPSFNDPLLSLYKVRDFSRFYFSSQHPYIYSHSSLQRLMEHNGFRTIEVINYQRYGLENHLNWLSQGQPGGSELFRELFKGLEVDYISALERGEKTDTTIWVGQRTA